MVNNDFILPMSGKLLTLEQVPDQVFAQKTLGNGFAIQLSGEVVVSPFDGTIIAAFPSGHAYIIRRNDGLEALIHIGLNSAGKSEAFRMQVEKYAQVKQGEILTYVNPKLLGKKEEDLISPIVFSNPTLNITSDHFNEMVAVASRDIIRFSD